MNSPQEEFTNLRKLLVCKRYEQPPPGYFNSFSEKVVDRLEGDEFVEYSSWWQWLVEKFDAKPVLVCVYGFVVSGLLLAGFRLSQIFENEVASEPLPGGPWLGTTLAGSSAALPINFSQQNFNDSPLSSFSASVDPVFRADSHSLLFKGENLRFSYQP
jgi:hypothetical protein